MRNRRATWLAVALTMAVAGVPASPATALTPAEIDARVDSLKETLRGVATELQAAEDELTQTHAQMRRHNHNLAEAEARRGELREALSQRAAQLYMYGSMNEMEIVSDGIGLYIDRLTYLDAVRSGERGLLEEVRALTRRSAVESALLREARSRALAAKERLDSRQSELSRQLGELQRLQAFLGNGSRQVIGGGNGFTCPVVGANVPLSNFGDPRPGGPHAGIDIRANTGQYVRAVLPATVVDTPTGSWWGIGIVIRDLAGTEWYYAHLSSRSVSVGQRLAPGEVIGRVGCTGTCYGSHLHFEWHPGGGGPRDPYSTVSAAC